MVKTSKCLAGSRRQRRRGVLTLEWILLVTVLFFGTLAAVATVRNELVGLFADLTDVICATDVCE